MNSRMWIKICGLTTEAGVEAAVRAQVDAIGFVFAASKRHVAR
jgi:phosphoribosylanthranilate isomerase